jgi:hypothetical protein
MGVITRSVAHDSKLEGICDGFGSHETLEILELCLTNNIILCRLPFRTSHKLQLCDVGLFAPLKTAKSILPIYTFLPLTQRNIRSGWAATGLYPFNPDIVLRDIPKPQAEIVVPRTATTITNTQDAPPQTLVTPVTPVTAEALTSLHDMIKQDTHVPDQTKMRIQKLANAAQSDRSQFLSK